MHDLDQIGLVCHDFINVFVGGGNFIDDAAIFSALNATGLLCQIEAVKASFGLASAHAPARTV